MKEFFHYTDPKNVAGILSHGLVPGAEIGEVHYYCGVQVDNTKIYLIKGLDKAQHYMRTMRTPKRLLRVNLLDDHPIERDYEQFLIYLRIPEEDLPVALLSLGARKAAESHRELFTDFLRHYGIDFMGDASEDNVRHHLKIISDEKWDEQSPCYATAHPIPAKFIRLVI